MMTKSGAQALHAIACALIKGRGLHSDLFKDVGQELYGLTIYDTQNELPIATIHTLDDATRVFQKLFPAERTDLYRRLRIGRDDWYRKHKTRLKSARESVDLLIDQATAPGVTEGQMHSLLMAINDIEFEFSGNYTIAGQITEELGLGDGQLTEEEHDAVNELTASGWSRADAVSEVVANRDPS